jgi:NitT/TauT family transport system substrate-binding protein
MLESEGLTESDVTLIHVRPEDMPSAIGFRVDAGYTWEPFAYRTISRGNHVLFNPDREKGLFPTVLAFKESSLESRPEDIRAFLNAWFAAAQFRQEHPNESRQMIASYFGLIAPDLPVDDQVQILNRDQNLTFFQKSSTGEDYTLFTAGKINAEFLMRIGVLTKLPDLDSLLDSTYLQ